MRINDLLRQNPRTTIFLHLACCAAISLVATAVEAQNFNAEKLQKRIFSAVEVASPAVVSINGGGIEFSGVIVTPEGHVLTAGHAVRTGGRYRLRMSDGGSVTGYGLGVSEELDIAMIKINNRTDLPCVAMGDSAKLVTNQPCLGLSFPGGQEAGSNPLVRFGYIVSGRAYQKMIQTTAVIQPGDSGGALFDLNGNLIGIHSSIGRSIRRNYEVPINTIKKYWTQLNRTEEFSTVSPPPLPKLGFSIDGLKVVSLDTGGPADQGGLRLNDVIVKVQDNAVDRHADVRRGLRAASRTGVTRVNLVVKRNDLEVSLNIAFEQKQRQNFELPQVVSQAGPAPSALFELKSLPAQFRSLESTLDEQCVFVFSKLGDAQSKIMATRVKDTRLLVSKSSMIGDDPFVINGNQQEVLKVVARDSKFDLALLQMKNKNTDGISLVNATVPPNPKLGRFLISPDPNSLGLVSIRGSYEFNSRKYESRGYLGVRLRTVGGNGGVLLEQVQNGAARKSGLKVGDIITQVDSTKIKNRPEIMRLLRKVDPNKTILVKFDRDGEQMERKLLLGAPPTLSSHPADDMQKSGRRDGFVSVVSHDANLHPNNCGGPVFDLRGRFIGLNIARNSRVRTYLLPGRIITSFVEQNREAINTNDGNQR